MGRVRLSSLWSDWAIAASTIWSSMRAYSTRRGRDCTGTIERRYAPWTTCLHPADPLSTCGQQELLFVTKRLPSPPPLRSGPSSSCRRFALLDQMKASASCPFSRSYVVLALSHFAVLADDRRGRPDQAA